MSHLYEPDNLLDQLSDPETLALHYRRLERREMELLAASEAPAGGEVVSIGCGWRPGRHLFPAPQWRLLAVDADPARPAWCVEHGLADSGAEGRAGELELEAGRFDAVLYRLVLHHIAYERPLEPVIAEAAALLRPGGVLVCVEPGLWHPVGLGLALANRSARVATRMHGTPDDVPLSPRALVRAARSAGLEPRLHAVTFAWRRLPPVAQRAAGALDRFGSARGMRALGHTLMLVARKPPA